MSLSGDAEPERRGGGGGGDGQSSALDRCTLPGPRHLQATCEMTLHRRENWQLPTSSSEPTNGPGLSRERMAGTQERRLSNCPVPSALSHQLGPLPLSVGPWGALKGSFHRERRRLILPLRKTKLVDQMSPPAVTGITSWSSLALKARQVWKPDFNSPFFSVPRSSHTGPGEAAEAFDFEIVRGSRKLQQKRPCALHVIS